ncbi:MAG: tetratricopeptide repeat protein [Bacteroidaceae bacterium]|nr:tetratricopeptide repeat protein [Bacteroidaceae bacterium]
MEDSNKYYQSRHFLRLLHRYEKAISEGVTPYMEADELTDIAEYYMTGKQDAKATRAIQAAIDMHPDSVDPQIFLARQKMFYGKIDEARSIIDAIHEQDDLEVIFMRAELLIKEDHVDEASDFLLEQTSKVEDSVDEYIYNCTGIFMDYDQWEVAHEWAELLKRANPYHPQLPIIEAEIEMGLDNYEEAYDMLKEILDKQPYNSKAWVLLAETCISLDYFCEALEATDFALAINPEDYSAILMKANAYMRDGMMPEAIEHYKKYLELQPDDVGVLISLAMCYNNEERYTETLEPLKKAEELSVNQPDREQDLFQILLLRAFVLSRLGKFHEALTNMDNARNFAQEEVMWKCYVSEGDIYLHAKRVKEAQQAFSDALEKSPRQADTLFSIAISYSNADYNGIAIDLLEDVWAIYGKEDGKFVVPYIANCYLRKGDIKNFLTYLQMAPSCDREATQSLFRDRYPDIAPEDYYAYAYKEAYGVFPDSSLEEKE